MNRGIIFLLVCLSFSLCVEKNEAGFRVRAVDGSSPRSDGPNDGFERTHRQADRNQMGFDDNRQVKIADYYFRRFDRDHDKRISIRESPEWVKAKFSKIDTNRDGSVDHQEIMKLLRQHRNKDRRNRTSAGNQFPPPKNGRGHRPPPRRR